jgi:hypothetical protein
MAVRSGRWKSKIVLSGAASFFARPLVARAQKAWTTIWQLMQLSVVTLAASTIVCSAGPCSPEIDRVQALLNARLEAAARTAPLAAESPHALPHHQPTPSSIASAEAELLAISADKAKIIGKAMARAHAADQAGDKATCHEALAEVQRTIGP